MRRCVLALLLTAIGCLASASASVIVPADNHVVVSTNVTRGSAAPQFNIWTGATGGRDPAVPAKWGSNFWTCGSASDPDKGACPTSGVWSNAQVLSVLSLRFTEARSGMSVVLLLHGWNQKKWADGQCPTGPMNAINDGVRAACGVANGTRNDEKRLWVVVSPAELARLPIGGVWKAELHLRLNQWPSGHLANFTAAITVNVTDNQNMQVYLPEFRSATPRVDLNLRHLPSVGGARVSGERQAQAAR